MSLELCNKRFLFACAKSLRRSEEHTSELQSQSNLVCRLLLEKKKKANDFIHTIRPNPPPDPKPVSLSIGTIMRLTPLASLATHLRSSLAPPSFPYLQHLPYTA